MSFMKPLYAGCFINLLGAFRCFKKPYAEGMNGGGQGEKIWSARYCRIYSNHHRQVTFTYPHPYRFGMGRNQIAKIKVC